MGKRWLMVSGGAVIAVIFLLLNPCMPAAFTGPSVPDLPPTPTPFAASVFYHFQSDTEGWTADFSQGQCATMTVTWTGDPGALGTTGAVDCNVQTQTGGSCKLVSLSRSYAPPVDLTGRRISAYLGNSGAYYGELDSAHISIHTVSGWHSGPVNNSIQYAGWYYLAYQPANAGESAADKIEIDVVTDYNAMNGDIYIDEISY